MIECISQSQDFQLISILNIDKLTEAWANSSGMLSTDASTLNVLAHNGSHTTAVAKFDIGTYLINTPCV